MKKIFILILMVFIFLGCVGCGKTKEINSALQNENTELKTKVEQLNNELNDFKNGSKYLISEIRNLFEQKDYDNVIVKADIIHQKYNGSSEDIEAQGLVNQIIAQREAEKQAKQEEQDRLNAEALKSKQDKLREIIRVKKVYIQDMDSAGGIHIGIKWVNNSNKVVKYAVFTVAPYNAVGDKVLNHSKYDSEMNCKDTGPFEKGQGNNGNTYWDGLYNSTATEIRLLKLEIEYMDGTKEIISQNDIQYIIY